MFVLKFCSFCICRTRWNSTEYQMKHASRSTMACRLHPEIPHPCRSASDVHTFGLAKTDITIFSVFLFWFIVQFVNIVNSSEALESEYSYLSYSQSENTEFWLLFSLYLYFFVFFISRAYTRRDMLYFKKSFFPKNAVVQSNQGFNLEIWRIGIAPTNLQH